MSSNEVVDVIDDRLTPEPDHVPEPMATPPPKADPRAEKLMQMMGGALSPEEMQIVLLIRVSGFGATLKEILSPTVTP